MLSTGLPAFLSPTPCGCQLLQVLERPSLPSRVALKGHRTPCGSSLQLVGAGAGDQGLTSVLLSCHASRTHPSRPLGWGSSSKHSFCFLKVYFN